MKRIIITVCTLWVVTACGPTPPSSWDRFEQKCKDLKGFVVQVDPPGWNDNGRFDCRVNGEKVFIPDVPRILQ